MISVKNQIAQEIRMNRFKSAVVLATIVALFSAATSAYADDNTFREIFRDALYGGVAVTLVGAAVMAFTKKPANHLDYMAFGAASGALVGASYGAVKTSIALATIDKGKVKIAIPTIIPDLVESRVTGQTTVAWKAEILRGTFN
jgi:hypothetical protein